MIFTKNLYLDQVIREKFGSPGRLCRIARQKGIQMSPTEIGTLINLKEAPYPKSKPGTFRTVCFQLEKLLQVPVEDLFPLRLYRNVEGDRRLQNFMKFHSSRGPLANVVYAPKSIPARKESNPVNQFLDDELRDVCEHVLMALSERDQEIVKLRLGWDGLPEYTFVEIGRFFRLTPMGAYSAFTTAIRKLRQSLRSRKLERFVPEGKSYTELLFAQHARRRNSEQPQISSTADPDNRYDWESDYM